MRHPSKVVGACISAALLSACGGNSLSSSTPAPAITAISHVRDAAGGGKEFLYVANQSTNNVSGYKINPLNGALTNLSGSPFSAGSQPSGLAVDPAGKFAYVSNQNYPNYSGTVYGYSINAASGALKQVSGSPYEESDNPYGVAVSPGAGKFAYIVNIYSNNVSAYTIAKSGSLTEVPGSPFSSGGGEPEEMAIDPSGKFAFVPNTEDDLVSANTIDPTTGALTPVGTYKAGKTPNFAAVDRTGGFVYVGNTNSDNISAFAIDPDSGALTKITGSPFSTTGSVGGLAVSPTANLLYVTQGTPDGVDAFTINSSNGRLSKVKGSPFKAGTGPLHLAVEPKGKYVYAANTGSNNISAFIIKPTSGALTEVKGSPFKECETCSVPLAIGIAWSH
jgi:6-phosphogluconolactonase